jgi:acyl-CoA thioester hydrolase
VGAAELCDRIVAVIAQHSRVQSVGPFGAHRARGNGVRGPAFARLSLRRCRRDLTQEFVEEQAPHRLRGARIAREQRAFDRFGKVRECEDWTIGVGEVGCERANFVGVERFSGGGGEAHGGRVFYLAMSNAYVYRHRLSVRFRDCDAMGHVNHAVYFTYFEQCRLTFWREQTGAPSPHARIIIARAECDYRAPAHFGDELEVRLAVAAIGRSSFTLRYEIVQAGKELLVAVGSTVMVAYDYTAGKSVPLPDPRGRFSNISTADVLQLIAWSRSTARTAAPTPRQPATTTKSARCRSPTSTSRRTRPS